LSFDVFISYASKDKTVADAVCARLESAGIRCWIAPRDVLAGTPYGVAIIEAIHTAKVMVLVFSSNANSSGHIPKEVERAVSKGLAILPFRIEDVAPGKSLDYFIGSVHWLDAMTQPMEKHLDALAATVHKLLPSPAQPEEPGVLAAQTSGTWQRNAPGVAPAAAVRSATYRESSHAASSNRIWIGVAAVALLAAIVMGFMLHRSGSEGGVTSPSAANTTSVSSPSGDERPTGGATGVTTAPIRDPGAAAGSGKQSLAAAAASSTDPIIGCYQWFNNAPVVIRSDGTMVAGPFTARWRSVSAERRAYTFTWPEATDTVTISPDQRSLSGGNQYGYPTSGTRLGGTNGLVGIWRWANGVPLTASPDGSFTAATFRGRWQASDVSRGLYTLTWPNPVDSVTLSADHSRISGMNQYGVAISGVRTEPCSEN